MSGEGARADFILHIARRKDWEAAGGRASYAPASLGEEGFVHCSTPAQVIATANRIFAGERDLVLLLVDPARVAAEIRYENLEGGGETFPHVYGPIDREAVLAAHPLPPGPDGAFSLPPPIARRLERGPRWRGRG